MHLGLTGYGIYETLWNLPTNFTDAMKYAADRLGVSVDFSAAFTSLLIQESMITSGMNSFQWTLTIWGGCSRVLVYCGGGASFCFQTSESRPEPFVSQSQYLTVISMLVESDLDAGHCSCSSLCFTLIDGHCNDFCGIPFCTRPEGLVQSTDQIWVADWSWWQYELQTVLWKRTYASF